MQTTPDDINPLIFYDQSALTDQHMYSNINDIQVVGMQGVNGVGSNSLAVFAFLLFFIFSSLGYKLMVDCDTTSSIITFVNRFYDDDDADTATNDDDVIDQEQPIVDQADKMDPIKAYESKYNDQYRALEKVDLSSEFVQGLKNSFIMESTPIGNVIMYYDENKSSFVYYSDNVIPYRFLEVLGRKYVCTFKCAKLYTNMEDEIKMVENKLAEAHEKEQLEKEQLEQLEQTAAAQKEQNAEPNLKNPVQKSVFAKFKNYNKDTSKDVVFANNNSHNTSNSNNNASNNNANNASNNNTNNKSKYTPLAKIILKENANRYTSEGKIANMPFLKKIDRKIVDKNYTMSFSEYKQLQLQQTSVKNV